MIQHEVVLAKLNRLRAALAAAEHDAHHARELELVAASAYQTATARRIATEKFMQGLAAEYQDAHDEYAALPEDVTYI